MLSTDMRGSWEICSHVCTYKGGKSQVRILMVVHAKGVERAGNEQALVGRTCGSTEMEDLYSPRISAGRSKLVNVISSRWEATLNLTVEVVGHLGLRGDDTVEIWCGTVIVSSNLSRPSDRMSLCSTPSTSDSGGESRRLPHGGNFRPSPRVD